MRRHFLLIPHLKIHNANAMSSPFTIGFPAMTAWLGSMHALERKLHEQGFSQINFSRLGISCHAFDLQTYKGKGDFVHSIVGTANPLDRDGKRPAFIEEARCHLDVSLLIELEDYSRKAAQELLEAIQITIMQMKFASGDVQKIQECKILRFDEDEDQDQQLKPILNKLMLGNVLVERRDLMVKSMEKGLDALDALLDHIKVTHMPTDQKNKENKVVWASSRKSEGWIVPIAVGYQGVSSLSEEFVLNQRDTETPHRFAESVVTLGEFKMPYRIESLDEILWEYRADLEKDLYLCCNQI